MVFSFASQHPPAVNSQTQDPLPVQAPPPLQSHLSDAKKNPLIPHGDQKDGKADSICASLGLSMTGEHDGSFNTHNWLPANNGGVWQGYSEDDEHLKAIQSCQHASPVLTSTESTWFPFPPTCTQSAIVWLHWSADCEWNVVPLSDCGGSFFHASSVQTLRRDRSFFFLTAVSKHLIKP